MRTPLLFIPLLFSCTNYTPTQIGKTQEPTVALGLQDLAPLAINPTALAGLHQILDLQDWDFGAGLAAHNNLIDTAVAHLGHASISWTDPTHGEMNLSYTHVGENGPNEHLTSRWRLTLVDEELHAGNAEGTRVFRLLANAQTRYLYADVLDPRNTGMGPLTIEISANAPDLPQELIASWTASSMTLELAPEQVTEVGHSCQELGDEHYGRLMVGQLDISPSGDCTTKLVLPMWGSENCSYDYIGEFGWMGQCMIIPDAEGFTLLSWFSEQGAEHQSPLMRGLEFDWDGTWLDLRFMEMSNPGEESVLRGGLFFRR